MKEKDKDSSQRNNKDVKENAKKHRSRRIIMPQEERAKKGRWVTILVLLLSLLLGYAFWR